MGGKILKFADERHAEEMREAEERHAKRLREVREESFQQGTEIGRERASGLLIERLRSYGVDQSIIDEVFGADRKGGHDKNSSARV